MKLQKLTYMAHGWNWAVNDEALVADKVEAWAYGPVYRELYNHTKSFGKGIIDRPLSPDDENPFLSYASQFGLEKSPSYQAHLTDREREVIAQVWARYGDLSGITLSELTHQQGTPWYKTYTERGESQVIPDEMIRAHYDHLADRVA